MKPLLILLLLAGTASAQLVSTPAVGKYPALRLQALVGTHPHQSRTSWYQKEMQIAPKLILEGESQLTDIPAAEATMLVITMNTRAKYVQHKEVLKVGENQTLPVPAAKGTHREFNFEELTVAFDAWKDASNVGGETYRYYVCGLRDPDTKEIVAFLTNDQTLDTYCKAHPEKREEVLKTAKGASFPSAFK